MKTAKQWATEFCIEHVMNVKGNAVEEFVKKVQDDARSPIVKELDDLRFLIGSLHLGDP